MSHDPAIGKPPDGYPPLRMAYEHIWTVREAEEISGFVASRLRAMRAARDRLNDSEGHAEMAALAPVSGGAWPGHDHARAALQLTLGLEELADLDIVVRDLDQGIVDFPTVIEGRQAYLCWREGEPSINHWHDSRDGFAARRPL